MASILVTSVREGVSVGATDQFMATAEDRHGKLIAGIVFAWVSSNTNVATVNSNGSAMALLPGTSQITATAEGITSNAVTLTVTPGFLQTGSLNTKRCCATATLLHNGTVLIAGGNNSGVVLDSLTSAELYDSASRTFTPTGSLNVPRLFHTATLLNNGKVLIAGGIDSLGEPLTSAELYDPAMGTFTLTGSMNFGRYQHTATLLGNGKVLVASGSNTSTAELYDPVSGTFTLTGSVNEQRFNHSAVLLNDGNALIAGGHGSSGFLSSAEIYDSDTGTFSPTGSLHAARELFSATLMNGGTVLAAGGNNGTALGTAELFDPTTGTFTATSSLDTARFSHVATLLNNGTILIAGGTMNAIGAVATVEEIYDPAARTFSLSGNLSAGRVDPTATLLTDGTVLITGGIDAGGTDLASAELYEPGSLTPPGLQSISVVPTSSTISPGTYQRYVAMGTFAGGPQQLASVTWSSSDTTTAEISNDITNPGAAVAVGSPVSTITVTITAAAGMVSGTATLNVGP